MNNILYNLYMEQPELFEKKYGILQEISAAMVLTDNVSTIANLMLDLAIGYTNSEKGSLMILDDRGDLSVLAARGIDPGLIGSYRVKIGEGIAGTVARDRVPVLVSDIETDDRFRDRAWDRYETKSFISCPVICKNRLLGVININDKKDGRPYTEDELDLMMILANQAAISLENAFLMNQLKVKAADLEDMNRKLIDADVMKTEFLTRVSHELRTPLNSIKGAIYVLRQPGAADNGRQEEFQDIIAMETDKLVGLVEHLLDFLRLEDEAKVLKKTVFDIRAVLREIESSKHLQTTLIRRNVTLTIEARHDLSAVVGDKIRVIQFFINLIEGLALQLEPGDAIRIIADEGEFIQLNILLSRPLPAIAIEHLMAAKSYFQYDNADEGLKLHLACRIAESHQWKLSGENRDNAFQLTVEIPQSSRQKLDAVVGTAVDMFKEFLTEMLDLNICSIMLTDDLTGELSIRSAQGLDDEIIKKTRIRIGDRIAGWVALEGKPLMIEDIEADPRFGRKSIAQYNNKSLISVPLKVGEKILGVVNLNNKKNAAPFTRRDFTVAQVVSRRISHFLDRLYSGRMREDEFRQFAASFESLLSAGRRYHKKDALLPELMSRLIESLGGTEDEQQTGLYIAMIYDLGLVLVDESVRGKKDLRPSELSALQTHPYTSVDLIDRFEFSDDVKDGILHHHERFDGSGYPDRLKGEDIPFLSRVLAVVDAYCSMLSDRPYRKAFTRARALKEIRKGAGSAYDPAVVAALEKAVKKL